MRTQKLSSGNFRVVISDGTDENGKRIFKSFTADAEWKAIKMAEDYKNQQKQPKAAKKRQPRRTVPDTSYSRKGVTLAKAFRNYIDTRTNVIEPTTLLVYSQIAANSFQSIMDMPLDELTTLDIQAAVNEESKRVSPKYVKNAYGLLRSVLKMHEVDLKLDSVKLPKLRKKDKELPPFETVYAIVKGTDSELPVLLAAWLSLRIGEVIGLQFRDVDREKHSIHVRRTIIHTKDGYEVRESCKTEKSDRCIHVPDYLLHLIMQQPHKSDTDFIIPHSRKSVYSKFKRLMAKHDIDMTFHNLRSLNASVMLMLGVPDKYAMERGGWSTDNILKSVYQQTFSSERERVDDLIDNYFSGIVSAENAGTNAALQP